MKHVTRTATILLLVSALLLFSSCDEKATIEKIKDVATETFIGALGDTVTDPGVVEAYLNGGMDSVREVAPTVFLGYTRNRVTELSMGTDVQKEAYKWLTENWPLVAKMLVREGEFGEEGLWVRFEVWAKSEGYPGASLNILGKLTQEQRDYLWPRFVIAVGEEYNAVKELEANEVKHVRTRTYDWE